jgi:hypothetical protein
MQSLSTMKWLLLTASLGLACHRPTGQRAAIGPEILEAGAGVVPSIVQRARTEAERDGRQLLIYVSATWCEPCERFQKALRAGQLNASFPRLTLLKFDSDRDGGRLQAAGYDGNFIPRFIVPGPDGRGTARRIEGGTKAEDTVATSIVPRLASLLGPVPARP